jgi:hypothetical protein
MSIKGWITVDAKKSLKPTLHMVQIPRDDWCDEFTDTERRIFLLLSSVFPKGLTAGHIADRLNKDREQQIVTGKRPEAVEWPVLEASDVGDLFYGDKEDVSDELMPYVVPVNPTHRPKRWRVKATEDE